MSGIEVAPEGDTERKEFADLWVMKFAELLQIRSNNDQFTYKPALLSNGVRIQVPPFITTGEKVVVDTNELTYLRRAD